MKKEDEKAIAELMKKYKLTDKNAVSNINVNFVMSSIGYMLNMKANLENSILSLHETLCLILLSAGENPDKCADLLGISVKTVNTYEQRYRKKLGAKNKTNAFYLAQLKGYLKMTV